MKLSVASFGKFVLVNLFLSLYNDGVSAVKVELHTFFPDALRKAKQGLNKVLRRSPAPPALVTPQRTGVASIDQALFQTSLIGSSMKGSVSRQLNTLMISKSAIPNIFMIFLSIVPGGQLNDFVSNMLTTVATMEQVAFVKDSFQHLQMVVRILVGSQILQIASVALQNTILDHVTIVNPTLQKAIELLPAAIPQLAILTLLAHGFMKFYNAVVLPFFQKASPANENEFIATFTPINFEEDDSVIVTDIASDLEFTTMPTESTKEDKAFEVNVTKISAVLDRFESKILSLVGGTRFHPSPSFSENDEIDSENTNNMSPMDVYVRATSETDVTSADTNDVIEVTVVCDDDLVNVTEEVDVQTDEFVVIDESCVESEKSASVEKECNPSLKSYEIIVSSSPSPLWSTLTTSPSKAAVRAFGVFALALVSVNVLPPVVRHSVAAIAILFILGMLVHEIRGAFSSREHTAALDVLIHDIEERALSFTKEMEPSVVASRQDEVEETSTSRSPLRYWRTRLPILDGIANFSSRQVLSPKNVNDENAVDSEAKELGEAAVPQFESAVHYYDETEQEAPIAKASSPKNLWRWKAPVYSQPKMTRTACSAIVGM